MRRPGRSSRSARRRLCSGEGSIPAQTTNLCLLQDLEDPSRTKTLADGDLNRLHTVADWITTFVVKPHKDLGRAGTVCPFVPGSLERKVLWLAPEQIAGRGEPDVVQLMNGYKRLFLETQPTGGDDAGYKVIVVVFTDLPADRAQGVFDDVLQHLAVPLYADDGILFGPYYEGNEATAIYNPRFRPFQSPVPFLFVRPGSSATGSSSWTTTTGSTGGHVATESPQPGPLPRNYAAPTGGSSDSDTAQRG